MPTEQEINQFLPPPGAESWSFFFDASKRFRQHYEALAAWYKARGVVLHYCNAPMEGGGIYRHYWVLAGHPHQIKMASAHINEPVPQSDRKSRRKAWRSRQPSIYF